MTTQTQTLAKTDSVLLPILLTAMLGIGVLFIAGFAQAEVLHDSAHDVRHAIGFACH